MPFIDVSDEAFAALTEYATRWNQTRREAVNTLIRLYTQPEHTLAAPCGAGETTGNTAEAVQR
jgi:hypothetical protein